MPKIKPKYYAVIGRAIGDDEDSCFHCKAATPHEAIIAWQDSRPHFTSDEDFTITRVLESETPISEV